MHFIFASCARTKTIHTFHTYMYRQGYRDPAAHVVSLVNRFPPRMMTPALAVSRAAARRRALLLEARKQREAWIQDEDYKEVGVVQALMEKQQQQRQQQEQPPSQTKKRGTLTGLFEGIPGLEGVMPIAREYVGFLNELAGEGDRETIELVSDASSAAEGDGEDEEGEGAQGEEAPPLPDIALNASVSLSYDDFVQLLAHPGSIEVVKSMQRFVTAFIQSQERREGLSALPPSSLSTPRPQGQHLHAFIESLRSEMCKSGVWAARLAIEEKRSSPGSSSSFSSSSSSAWDGLREHLEKFLVIKLYRYLFTEAETQTLRDQEAAWQARLDSLAFLGPEHLEVRSLISSLPSTSISTSLAPAIAEFSLVPSYKAPVDIMSCLLRCSYLLSRGLVAAHPPGTGLPGADEFLPAMILMIKESKPSGLRKALDIVQCYRYPPRLQVSEPAYVFTNVLSAVHFLETAKAGQLNMTPEVFERSLVACSRSMGRWREGVFETRAGAGGGGGGVVTGEEEEGHGVGVLPVLSALKDMTLKEGTSLSSSSFLSSSLVVGNGHYKSSEPHGSVLLPARSIQDIRRERMAGAAAARVVTVPSTAAVSPSNSTRSFTSLRLHDLLGRIQDTHRNRSSSSNKSSSNSNSSSSRCTQGKHQEGAIGQPHLLQSLSSEQLKKACSFLTVPPQDLRVSDMSALLSEYRCLAIVAGECLNLLQEQRR